MVLIPASGNTNREASVTPTRFLKTLYRDSSRVLKICAPKTCAEAPGPAP